MSSTILVSNLSDRVTNDTLLELCQELGEVVRVSIPRDHRTRAPKGFGFIEFASSAAARGALRLLDGITLHGNRIRVSLAASGKAPSSAGRPGDTPPEGFGRKREPEPWEDTDRGYGGSKGRGGWREQRHRQGHRRGAPSPRTSRSR